MTPSHPRTTRRRRLLLRLPLAACGGGFLFALLISCSPMPGNFGMIDGVTRVHSLGEMEVVEHPGGLIETASACNRLHWGRGERIGVLLTGGCTLGCSLISGPAVGQIERCEIWYPEGWEWVRQHELQHCKGYADLF